MSSIRLGLLIGVLLAAAANICDAQPAPTPTRDPESGGRQRHAAFRAWWKRLSEVGPRPGVIPVDGYKIQWRVDGKRFDEQGRDVTPADYSGTRLVSLCSKDRWRVYDSDGLTAGGFGDTMWTINSSNLDIFRTNDPEIAKDASFNPEYHKSIVVEYLSRLLGSWDVTLSGVTADQLPVPNEDGSWRIQAKTEVGTAYCQVEMSGGFDAESGVGWIDRSLIRVYQNDELVETWTSRYDGWQDSWIPKLKIASHVHMTCPQHGLYEDHRFESYTPIESKELKEVSAVPKPGSSDPLFGRWPFTSVRDFRKRGWGPEGEIRHFNPDGTPTKDNKPYILGRRNGGE